MLYYTSSISKYIFVHCGKSHGLLMSHMIRYFQCFCCKNEIKAEIPKHKFSEATVTLHGNDFFFCILVKMIVVIYENLTEKIKIALKVSCVFKLFSSQETHLLPSSCMGISKVERNLTGCFHCYPNNKSWNLG